MVTEAGNLAPYAPTANVVGIIRRLRERNVPDPLGAQELVRMSIPEGNVSRVLVALRFLGFLDDEGHHTEAFKRIGKASDEEYRKLLADAIRSAYSHVFHIGLDPATATDGELENAFRAYEPRAQRPRMVTLFRGLCQEAGLAPGGPPETRTRRPQVARAKASSNKAQVTPRHEREADRPLRSRSMEQRTPVVTNGSQDHQLLHGLIDKLPASGKWTQDERDRWLRAVEAMVDVLVEIETPKIEPVGYLGPPGSSTVPEREKE